MNADEPAWAELIQEVRRLSYLVGAVSALADPDSIVAAGLSSDERLRRIHRVLVDHDTPPADRPDS